MAEILTSIHGSRLGIGTDGTLLLDGAAVDFSTSYGNGTAGSPSWAFGADTDTGIYRVGANSLGIAAGGNLVGSFSSSGYTPTLGVAPAGGFSISPRNWHTGGCPATQTTDGTNLDAVVTELYVAEVYVPANATITGIAVFNGGAVAGNGKVMLFDSAGNRLGISASTAMSGTDAYQKIDLSTPLAVKGPATYYVGCIFDSASHDLNTHILGSFGAGKITGLVYATEAGYATITPPSTFTTGLGPIASLY